MKNRIEYDDIVVSSRVLEWIDSIQVVDAINRFLLGDWGDIAADVNDANNEIVKVGMEEEDYFFAVYHTHGETPKDFSEDDCGTAFGIQILIGFDRTMCVGLVDDDCRSLGEYYYIRINDMSQINDLYRFN